MKMRRFTDAGIAAVRELLPQIKTVDDLARAEALATNDDLAKPIDELASLDLDETRVFPTTFAFCEYFHGLIKDHKPLTYRTDVGFWTWLAMVYVRQLVKVDADFQVDIGMMGRIIFLAQDYKRSYRHLLASPYYAFLSYSESPSICEVVAFQALNSPGDFVDQILTRNSLLQNPCVLVCLSNLYLDDHRRLKVGATKSIRRFIAVYHQLSMTHDFCEIEDVDALISLLPKEFDVFAA